MSKEAEPEPTAPRFGMETLNSAVQTLAIVLAGAWGVYTFVYEAKIAPGLAPPSVSVTSTLERVGQRGDLVAIRSTVTRTNVGRTEVRVLGLTYNVVGVKTRFVEAPAARAMPGDLPGSSTVAEARDYDVGRELRRFQALAGRGGRAMPVWCTAKSRLSRRARSQASQARSSRRLWPAAARMTLAASPSVPSRKLRPSRPSLFMWPMTGSMALRRRRSRRMVGVTPRFWPARTTRSRSASWPR